MGLPSHDGRDVRIQPAGGPHADVVQLSGAAVREGWTCRPAAVQDESHTLHQVSGIQYIHAIKPHLSNSQQTIGSDPTHTSTSLEETVPDLNQKFKSWSIFVMYRPIAYLGSGQRPIGTWNLHFLAKRLDTDTI